MTAENPKKACGAKKPSPHLISPIAILTETFAARIGAQKYGPYNWRDKPIDAVTYYDAALRHWMLWLLGEDNDPETGVSHLGNARVCAGIVLDAIATGKFIDNRPKDELGIAEVKRLFGLMAVQEESKHAPRDH